MKLITEVHDPLELITEGEGAEKKHYLKGLFLEFDGPNRNGRIYRSEYHDDAVKTWIKEKMEDKRGWGELDHPEGATINLRNVSHRIIEMHKDGSNWFGKSILSNEGMGKIAMGLLATGGNLGSSSRGVGSVKEMTEGVLEVQRDYRIITPSDLVSDPSAHGAIMAGIMEGVEYYYDETHGTYIAEKATTLKNEVRRMSLKEIEDKKVALIEKFLSELRFK
jgi:hypothetical protein